jgi:hypothetical protein
MQGCLVVQQKQGTRKEPAMDQEVYVAVIAGAAVLFFLPSIIALIRGTDPLWIVLLLNVIPLGVTWIGAWLAVFMLPRATPVPVRQALPVRDDPKYLFGIVPPEDPAGASQHHDDARTGAPAWS